MRPIRKYIAVFIFATCAARVSSDERLSPKELLAVRKFHEMVKDGFTQEIQREEKFLIRWIRAKDFDLEAAEKMLRRNFEWRKENNIDNILNEDFGEMRRLSNFHFSTHDYEGRPALVSGLGQMDVRRFVLTGLRPKLDRYLIYAYERLVNFALNSPHVNGTGKGFVDAYMLFNMNGFSRRTHSCLACIPSWITLAQNYENNYPQLGRYIITINTPKIFQTLLNILRPFLTPHTANALRLYGFNRGEWKRELLKLFPENQLPLEFGGTLNLKKGGSRVD